VSDLPWMKFYPADWLQDTRCLTKEARAVWIDLICQMWVSPRRGKLKWTQAQFNSFIGAETDPEFSTNIWNQLAQSCVGNFQISGDFLFISCRRMIKEEHKRNQVYRRVKRFRNANVTQNKRIRGQKSDIRSQISDKKEEDTSDANASDPCPSVKEFTESWNQLFKGQLSLIELPLSRDRERRLKLRLAEHPSTQYWEEVFGAIDSSPFLLGKTDSKNGHQGWRCTFDFLIANSTNCVKIHEGQYEKKGN